MAAGEVRSPVPGRAAMGVLPGASASGGACLPAGACRNPARSQGVSPAFEAGESAPLWSYARVG